MGSPAKLNNDQNPSSERLKDGLYRAAWIIPVAIPPIENGFVRVFDGLIAEIGRTTELSTRAAAVDLGDVAVLPGLVNAHTHLEFSDLEGPIGVSGNSLPEWVSAVVKHRQSDSQLKQTRQMAIKKGLAELSAAGTALVADICTFGSVLTDWLPRNSEPIPELICLLEILGLSPERAEQCIEWAEQMHRQWEQDSLLQPGTIEFGVSPHAPYSVPMQLLDRTIRMAGTRRQTVAMHFAECEEELELVEHGCGPFRDSLESIGVFRENLFPVPGGMDSVLRSLTQVSRGLIVHGNYLTNSQIELLAKHPQLTVVYCPRTHAFFGHRPHPISKLLKGGIRVVLGTDSRASNPDLSIWREAQYLFQVRTDLAPSELLRMITLEAAEGLGRREYGRIEPGSPARLVQVPLPRKSLNSKHLIDCIFEQNPKAIRYSPSSGL